MSLGDLVISLSANTATLQSDMGKANQILERFAAQSIRTAQQGERAMKVLAAAGLDSVDRLKIAFDNLGIQSAASIEKSKERIVASYERIRTSGVATADEIKRAHEAMNAKIAQLDGGPGVARQTEGMNLFGLASAAAILKIQVLYSLVNTVMSQIGQAPGAAVDAIENFNSAAISSAALITSMQKGTEDIGKRYKENKQYATAVQEVLVKMDAETAASAQNLTDMNRKFVEQGVLIDTNNTKQIEGFKNIANALAALTSGDANKNMQYTQEISALMRGENRPSNKLFQLLNQMDNGNLKEHLELWQKTARETGNYGLILEKIGPMLSGFAAAQGDINNLWETVKSTMGTIRDEVLRGGLSEGFAQIVEFMKEISRQANDNKERIQAFLRDSFNTAIKVSGAFWNIAKAIGSMGEPLMWAAVTAGIYSAVSAMSKLVAEMTLATGGMNLLIAGAVALGIWGGKKIAEYKNTSNDAAEIRARVLSGHAYKSAKVMGSNQFANVEAEFGPSQLEFIRKELPMASNDQIVKLIEQGAITVVRKTDSAFNEWYNVVQLNKERIDKVLKGDDPKVPKNLNVGAFKEEKTKTETFSEYNSFVQKYRQAFNAAETDEYKRKLMEIDDKYSDLEVSYNQLTKAEKESLSVKEGITAETLKQMKLNEIMAFQKREDEKRTKIALSEANKLAEEKKRMENELIKEQKLISSEKHRVAKITQNLPDMWGGTDRLGALKNQYDEEIRLLEDKMLREEQLHGKNTDMYKIYQDEQIALGEAYAARQSELETQKWTSIGGIISGQLGQMAAMMDKGNEEQFIAWKALAIAQATIATALAVAAIMAQSAFFGPFVAFGLAATAGAIGAAQIGIIAGTKFQKREMGGPVSAGESYIVGEKRPELFTPGVSGVITPYVPSGKGGVTINQSFSITGVAADLATNMKIIAKQAKDEAVNTVYQSMQRGGQFAVASGRRI